LPDEPASAAAIIAKFEQNCEAALSRGDAARLRDTVLGIERVADVSQLTRLLQVSGGAAGRKQAVSV
jgi:hypothetical protein